MNDLRVKAVAAAGVVVIALVACGRPDAGAPAAVAQAEAAEHDELRLSTDEVRRAGLTVEALSMQSFADTVAVTATIRVNQDRIAQIAPRVEGRVVRIAVDLGQAVRPGQVLATIDSLALGEAQSTLQQAQAGRRVAEADFRRAETLIADEIIPQRDFLRARADFEKASAEVRAATDRIRLLGGSGGPGSGASNVQLTSPLAGTVIEKKATVGELHGPSEPMFTVADLSTVWIEADLTDAMLSRVRTGAPAHVTVAAYPGERFSGHVTYVASVLDPESRTVAARIEVSNTDGRLKPGMFASAVIESSGKPKLVLSVPDASILLLQGQPTVFVEAHGGYEPRAIESGGKLAGRTVIRSGVESGEKVVTSGAYALKARLLKSQIGDAH